MHYDLAIVHFYDTKSKCIVFYHVLYVLLSSLSYCW